MLNPRLKLPTKTADAAGEVYIWPGDMGGQQIDAFDITLQVKMAAGTASVFVLGPLEEWALWRDGTAIPTMATGQAVVITEGAWGGIKVVFTNAANTGLVGTTVVEKAGFRR